MNEDDRQRASASKVEEDEEEVNPGKKRIRFRRDSHFYKWLQTCCTLEFLFEVLILVIHPLPYIDKEYTFNIINMLGSKDQLVPVKFMLGDFLFAFMFMRCYFIIRTIMNFSSYSDLHSKKICSKYGFESNTSFCFKALILKNPGLTILFTAVMSIMWLSYLLRIFER